METKEKIKNKNREYYQTHRKEQKQRVRKWKKAHPEKVKEYDRSYQRSEEGKEKIKERNKKPEYQEYKRNYMRGYMKIYCRNMPQKLKQKKKIYGKEYYRKYCLRSGNKQIRLSNKRPFPEDNKCELCNKEPKKFLIYHHWDPQNLSKGLFVCWKCHMLVESYEQNRYHLIQRYLRLKKQINKEYKKLPKQLELKELANVPS